MALGSLITDALPRLAVLPESKQRRGTLFWDVLLLRLAAVLTLKKEEKKKVSKLSYL